MKAYEKWNLITPGSDNLPSWLQKYAGSCSILPIKDSDFFHLYITGRDSTNRSVIGRAVWDPSKPQELQEISKDPIIELGDLGTFYDSGMSYPFLLEVKNDTYMYFTGWKKGSTVPFYNRIGLCIKRNNEDSFVVKQSPILPLTDDDCFGSGSMQVIKEKESFTMFYTSFLGWTNNKGKISHKYKLKRTNSSNGIIWDDNREHLITNMSCKFDNICKPFLHKENFYFCARDNGEDYSIYVLEDYLNNDENIKKVDFSIVSSDWDAYGQAYPTLIDINEKTFLFYSGNNYGEGGMGVAIL